MGNVDYSQLIIEKLIIHDIPKHKKNEEGAPYYSESESIITDGLRVFFQDKVKSALNGNQALKVCFKTDAESSVPVCTQEILNTDNEFIQLSKNIAIDLFNIQKGTNSAGVLLVIRGKIQDNTVCIILKLEKDKGAQLVLNTATRTFDVEEIQNLMLTNKTKIFKVALFIRRDDFQIDYDGLLMDYQINIKDKKGTNSFFLDFIGCRPYADPKITTKNFYNYTRAFIDSIPDDLARTKYIQDLNSYLQKNQNTINPREFAEEYMSETDHKNQYEQYLRDKGFALEAYTKDNTLINSHIKKIILEFSNGISILGNKGSFEKKVKLKPSKKPNIIIATIKSKIKNIK